MGGYNWRVWGAELGRWGVGGGGGGGVGEGVLGKQVNHGHVVLCHCWAAMSSTWRRPAVPHLAVGSEIGFYAATFYSILSH